MGLINSPLSPATVANGVNAARPACFRGLIGAWSATVNHAAHGLVQLNKRRGSFLGGMTAGPGYWEGDGIAKHLGIGETGAELVANLSDFTYSIWVNINDKNNGIVFSESRSSNNNPVSAIQLYESGAKQAKFIWRNDTPTTYEAATGTDYLTIGEWTHFCVVREGSNITLYLDAIIRATVGSVSGTITVDRRTLGALRRTTTSLYSNAKFDDALIYNRALERAEVRQLATLPRGEWARRASSFFSAPSPPPPSTANNLTLLGVG